MPTDTEFKLKLLESRERIQVEKRADKMRKMRLKPTARAIVISQLTNDGSKSQATTTIYKQLRIESPSQKLYFFSQQASLDKESNWFRHIRIHAAVYGLALLKR